MSVAEYDHYCYSLHLIWEYAEDSCPVGSDLRPDIESGKQLLHAAPDLLRACERLLRAEYWSCGTDRMDREERAALLTAAIAKAKGGA